MSKTALEAPILFSDVMVQAILAGKKTQTRRMFPYQPQRYGTMRGVYSYRTGRGTSRINRQLTQVTSKATGKVLRCEERTVPLLDWLPTLSRFKVGQKLWVREAFYVDHVDYIGKRLPKERPAGITDDMIYYRADTKRWGKHAASWCCQQIAECSCAEIGKPKLRPSIFMPRWASRITLEVTAVRAEPLSGITEADALAEGMQEWTKDGRLCKYWPGDFIDGPLKHTWHDLPHTARQAFTEVWDRINGRGAFVAAEHKYVQVVTFNVLQKPAGVANDNR